MNRFIALTAGVFLSIFLIGPVNAASDGASGNQQVQQDGKQGKIRQTPESVKAWHAKQQKRREAKKRAAAIRQQKMSTNSGN